MHDNTTDGDMKKSLGAEAAQEDHSTDTPKCTDPIKNVCEPKSDLKELVEQYRLWKLQQKIASGKFGSVHIVSNLDEEPSEENRFIPKLPPDVRKPVLVENIRFTIKRYH